MSAPLLEDAPETPAGTAAAPVPPVRRAASVWRRWLPPMAMLAVLCAVGWMAVHVLAGVKLADVLHQAELIRGGQIALAGAFALLGYGALCLYDRIGLHYTRRSVPWHRSMPISFIAYSFGHNLSMPAFTAVAVRYRLYSKLGLSAIDVAKLSAFCSVSSGLAICTFAGASLFASPGLLSSATHIAPALVRGIGAAGLVAVAVYFVWSARQRASWRGQNWELQPPGIRLAVVQVLVGIADLSLAAMVLWGLLPPELGVSMFAFVGVYVVAVATGILSHVPGGLGVIETVLLIALPQIPSAQLLAALAIYRGIYYLLPLALAALAFALFELPTVLGFVRRVFTRRA